MDGSLPTQAEFHRWHRTDLLYGPDELIELGGEYKFHANDRIMSEGDETDFCLILRSGSVKIVRGSPARFLGVRGPGEIIGEQAALFGVPRGATIYALTNGDATWISGTGLRTYCDKNLTAYKKIAEIQAWRGRESDRRSVASYFGAERRLAILLEEIVSTGQTELTQDGHRFIRLTQREIAESIGISRESIVNVVRTMKHGGILHVEKSKTVIMNWETLQKIAAGEKTAAVHDDPPGSGET
jgi:CRP-like cAMP-binding protein